jgi:hypothetical protein
MTLVKEAKIESSSVFHRHRAASPSFSTISTACGKNKEILKKF